MEPAQMMKGRKFVLMSIGVVLSMRSVALGRRGGTGFAMRGGSFG
jgi:hypothetical protein